MRKIIVSVLVCLLASPLAAATTKTKKKTTKKSTASAAKFTPADGVAISHAGAPDRTGPDEIYNDADQNPGATDPSVTQDNIAQTICNKAFKTETVRPPSEYTDKLKKAADGGHLR